MYEFKKIVCAYNKNIDLSFDVVAGVILVRPCVECIKKSFCLERTKNETTTENK